MTLQKLDSYNVALKRALLEATDKSGRPLTQRKFSGRVRIDETRFSRILHGKDVPTASERKRIARQLERPDADLFPPVEHTL